MNKLAILSLVVAAASACGFDCNVQGEKQSFSSCEALQEAFDAEQSRLDPPPSDAVLDDLDTCGTVNGCEIQQ